MSFCCYTVIENECKTIGNNEERKEKAKNIFKYLFPSVYSRNFVFTKG